MANDFSKDSWKDKHSTPHNMAVSSVSSWRWFGPTYRITINKKNKQSYDLPCKYNWINCHVPIDHFTNVTFQCIVNSSSLLWRPKAKNNNFKSTDNLPFCPHNGLDLPTMHWERNISKMDLWGNFQINFTSRIWKGELARHWICAFTKNLLIISSDKEE